MKDVFVICNQHTQFLGKQGQWLDESEPAAAWRSPHRDVALNHMIEVNARDIEQRLTLLQCPLNEKDIPLLGDATEPRKVTPVTYDEQDVVVVESPEDEGDQDNDQGSEAHENEQHDSEQHGE
ncbi:MAG TPA: hypothetical protein VLB90_01035 [Pseudomonadales bacterium]|nr:hypothetical protein [Pseudomonadales bacterium]